MALADRELITRLLSAPLDEVLAEARARRHARGPGRMTYSPKVFIPLTRLCADVCHYCTFATTPSQLSAPYMTPEEVLEVARTFRERGLPCDALYLDIHYMDDYRVFTFHPDRFPNPRGLTDELHRHGFRTVTIVDGGGLSQTKEVYNTVSVTVTYSWDTGVFGRIPVSSTSVNLMSY